MKISGLSFSCLILAASFLAAPGAFAARTTVKLAVSDMRPGSIVIRHGERKLYFVISRTHAYKYPVAVPKPGQEWWGAASVQSLHLSPAWKPPAIVKAAKPTLPDYIPAGAPNNPMGTHMIMLNLPEIAIHGTANSMRESVLKGRAASFGCIRMLNEDIQELYSLVGPGTPVVMLR